MILETLNRAFVDAGIDPMAVTPVITIGAHYTPRDGIKPPVQKWAVYVAAANAWAFLLPMVEPKLAIEVAQGIANWDTAMAYHKRPTENDITKAMWAAMVMDDCPLKRVIDSAHKPL